MRIYALSPVKINPVYSRNNKSGLIKAVNFKGQDLLNLSEKEVMNKIQDSFVPENFLGQGTEAEVYRIKGTDFCVRIPYGMDHLYRYNYTKELTPADKINHIVAKLGFGASIMKYFNGVTPKLFVSNENSRHKLQSEIAEMPVKSYTELLHQIADAIDNELIFDYSGGNLIVDTEKNKLTAIDFCSIIENPRSVKPLNEMYHVLTCYGAEKETGKKIFDKVILTGLEEFKPGNIPCMDLELFDFIDLALKRNRESCHYKQGNLTNNIHKFNNLISSISNSLTTLKQIKKKEIIDKTLAPELINKIREFRRLITKIH